jgi:hypothetical protein
MVDIMPLLEVIAKIANQTARHVPLQVTAKDAC